MSELKDVYWMATPLAIDQRNNLNDKKRRFLKPAARYIDPKNEIHVYRKIQHWTLEVDGMCYELSPDTKKKLTLIKKTTDMVKPHSIDATEWREIREIKEIKPEKRRIGQTRLTHTQIEEEGKFVVFWPLYHHGTRFGKIKVAHGTFHSRLHMDRLQQRLVRFLYPELPKLCPHAI